MEGRKEGGTEKERQTLLFMLTGMAITIKRQVTNSDKVVE